MGRKKRELTAKEETDLRRMAASSAYGAGRIALRLGVSEKLIRRLAVEKGIVIQSPRAS